MVTKKEILKREFDRHENRMTDFLYNDQKEVVLKAMEEYKLQELKELTKQRDRYWHEKQDQARTIQEQNEILNSHAWVPTSERLPKPNVQILVWHKELLRAQVIVLFSNEELPVSFSHWQELIPPQTHK